MHTISDVSNMLYPNAPSRCYKKRKAVRILWNDNNGISDQYETIIHIPKSKWNKQIVGSWRLDIKLNS